MLFYHSEILYTGPTLSLATVSPVRLDHATRMILLSGIFPFSVPVSDDALCLFITFPFRLCFPRYGQVQEVDLAKEEHWKVGSDRVSRGRPWWA